MATLTVSILLVVGKLYMIEICRSLLCF